MRSSSSSLVQWFFVSWADWVERIVYLALIPFLCLQLPQIVKNIHYLRIDPIKISILPWISYAAGIVGNSNLWSYHIDGMRNAVALVQMTGVISAGVVLTQIFLAGFVPDIAMISIALFLVATLFFNIAKWNHCLNDPLWKFWRLISKLVALVILPMAAFF